MELKNQERQVVTNINNHIEKKLMSLFSRSKKIGIDINNAIIGEVIAAILLTCLLILLIIYLLLVQPFKLHFVEQ